MHFFMWTFSVAKAKRTIAGFVTGEERDGRIELACAHNGL